jgi:hypothetical protein
MLNETGELLQIRRKEANSMKIAIPFLSAALLVGGFVAAGNADVLSQTESALGDNYCHLRLTAITADSLVTNHPISKGPDSGDIIDFYGPCNENPVGQDQVVAQKLDQQHRPQNEFAD